MWTNEKKKKNGVFIFRGGFLILGTYSDSQRCCHFYQWRTVDYILACIYFRCSVLAVGKLPGLIQCSLCHRQQGAGLLLCMTDWNEAAEPRCGQNTTLNTALPKLHTPDSTDSFPIHISPADPMQHKVWHAASIGVQWERGSERRGCQQPTSTRAAPSSLATHSSRVTAGARCSCSMYS